jgi:hypothetical protein
MYFSILYFFAICEHSGQIYFLAYTFGPLIYICCPISNGMVDPNTYATVPLRKPEGRRGLEVRSFELTKSETFLSLYGFDKVILGYTREGVEKMFIIEHSRFSKICA